ncbi:unnamed protein product [Adineta ricciae]|uniref:Transposase n=2 Tax=Adineta ricciae TaxID=249248 RepID=A0A815VEV3_ADIRI|nr:unnamed protein product [Adineta ricciae]
MSSTYDEKSTLSKAELQRLVSSDDPLISFKKPSNKRSDCWTNFSQVYHSNNAQDYIVCLVCKSILKWTKDQGTRVMTHHNCVKVKSPSTTPTRQRTISSYCTHPSLSKECPLIRKRITEVCVEYCALDGRSFESVAGTGFKALAKQLVNAGATLGTSVNVTELLPDPSTISRNVEQVYFNLKKQLISLCVSLECFSITCDFWTAKLTGVHYGGISLHYVDEHSQLRMFTLSCQAYDFETQHAINLRSFVNKVLQEYGLHLNDEIFVVTDNENKMKSAFKDDCIRVGCSAHYLNKILEHAFLNKSSKCEGAQLLFKLVRAIITNIRQSHKQSLLSTAPINYSNTRFSGVYLMCNSFLKVYYELPKILGDEQKKSYLEIDHESLQSLCKYLAEFFKVIEKLSCEKKPTIHLVVPYKQYLINLSVVNDNDNHVMAPLKRYIGKELPDYWVLKDIHFIATMLHPNLKSFNHTPNQKYHAEALLKEEFDKCQQNQHPQASSATQNNKRKQTQQNNTKLMPSLDDIFDLPTAPDESSNTPELKSEFDRYLEDKTKIAKDADVLTFWENHESSYPTLAKIAKRVLSIPATNTAVERLFSDSGNTITNRRTRLQTSKVNQLLFIRRNLSQLKELFPTSLIQTRKRTISDASVTPSKKRKFSIEDCDKSSSQEFDIDDLPQEDVFDNVLQEDAIHESFQHDIGDGMSQDDNEEENYL